jgi:polyhydroxyalkanoate synthesis regulator phasin
MEEEEMSDKERGETEMGISGRIRESFAGSWPSLSKIEAEGQRFVRGLAGTLEKHGIDPTTKAVEDLGRDARAFMNQFNQSIEESAQKVLEGLSVPTREDVDSMAKQVRGNLEEQVLKGIGRLNLASRKEVETVAKDLKKLQKDVVKLSKAAAQKSPKAAPKKTKTAAKRKVAKK